MKNLSLVVYVFFLSIVLPGYSSAEVESRIVTGDVIANRTVTLATRIMGRITNVHAEEGDSVKADTVVVEIDDTELSAKLRSAEAAEERARAEHAHSKRVKNRLNELARKNLTSEDAVDEAEYAYQVAKANLKAAQAEIESIRTTLAETRIKVPFDAVVIKKYAETGMVTQPGEPLFQVQDQSRLKFRARVNERDLHHIKLHDEAQINIAAISSEPIRAKVIRIIPFGDQRHTFAIELELPNVPGLYPGMFGKAVFSK
jgi:RND family efflux transporter MFP subunit